MVSPNGHLQGGNNIQGCRGSIEWCRVFTEEIHTLAGCAMKKSRGQKRYLRHKERHP